MTANAKPDTHLPVPWLTPARARWLAGEVNPASRLANPNRELPTFAEGMGEMFLGRRLMDARKRLFDQWRDSDRKKK